MIDIFPEWMGGTQVDSVISRLGSVMKKDISMFLVTSVQITFNAQ